MKVAVILSVLWLSSLFVIAQDRLPKDYLKPEFHKGRREALRTQMPKNSVAVFFANPVRNRANDVDFIYHQDPNFYYLTGYKEPHAVLVVFSETQTNTNGDTYNEILYVQERDPKKEQWNGYRLGVQGAKEKLGFQMVFEGKAFLNSGIDFTIFDQVLFFDFKDDYRDSKSNADLYDLITSFKSQIHLTSAFSIQNEKDQIEEDKSILDRTESVKVDTTILKTIMATLRQIKTSEELVMLKKAIRISAIGQREVMKAIHSGMSETEIQGIHEYIYKIYGCESEGYPSIVGAGSNGCVLHYIENNKMTVESDLVLMDLGAEYHGYTADVTRTIPANGEFSKEQKLLYDLVYKAQEAGIAAALVGNEFKAPDKIAKEIIYDGLIALGIAKNKKDAKQYFPHGTSHHIGLDVHDPSLKGDLEPNMVITVEPGIYIPKGSNCDSKWHGIGIRIEDDILITENGPVNLSAEAPRTTEAIEALMKEKSVLNDLKLPKLD
jgi:Xaa-Pro aminopeptidase